MDSARDDSISHDKINHNWYSCDVEMTETNAKDEFYLNLNSPDKIVISSFENFVKNGNFSQKENFVVNRNIFSQWDFMKDLEERFGIKLDSEEVLNKIPNLGTLANNLKEGRLIKFNCMVQNILENQLYLALAKDKFNKEKYNVNKYFECHNNSMIVDNDEDLFGDDHSYSNESILMDRLALNCVVIPGLSPILCKKFEIDENLQKKKIIVYDYENSQIKVNQELMVIGVAYEIENIIVIHSWKIIQNYFKFECERNTNINMSLNVFDYDSARNLIQDYLKLILNGDELLAEYLNIFLVSQIFYRLDTKLIGKFLINIINQKISKTTEEESFNSDYYKALQNFLQLLTNFSKTFDISINSLNQSYLYPRFDINTEELTQGDLQSVDHTFILLDERNLKEGKLSENGIKNFNSIKTLIHFQSMSYLYPYNTIEIPHDTQLLTVSDVCKSMFNSSELVEIPFMNGIVEYSVHEHEKNIAKYFSTICDRDVAIMTRYLDNCRYREDFVKKFKIDDEICKMIQKDFIENKNENFSAEDLDLCMKIARLYAISRGRSDLVYEDYTFAKECEMKRKNRLRELKKKI